MIVTLSAGPEAASTDSTTSLTPTKDTAPRVRRAIQVSTSTTTLDGETRALQLAKAAFEYRDFTKVIKTLNEWVHPPRISNPMTMLEARKILGVAFHVTGQEKNAREEFAQVLLLDPNHQLDPFLVPPDIVATFEDVRRQLEPRLGPRVPDRLTAPVTSGRPLRIHRAVAWLPLGVPQFVLNENVTGVLFASAQLLGLAVNITSFLYGQSLLNTPNPGTNTDVWAGMQYGGLSIFLLAYGSSVMHGYALISQYETGNAEAATAPFTSGRSTSDFPTQSSYNRAPPQNRAIFGPSLRFRF